MKFTRRNFLKTAAGAALVAGAGGWAAEAAPSLFDSPSQQPAAAPPALFSAPEILRYDARCFTIRGRNSFLFSASMHYSRCPEPLWVDRLEKLRRAGFNTIQSYVFWNYHEPVEGQADLGEFDRFASLVGRMGFWMIARPGPYVCAEWDGGGFPHWVIARQFPLRSNDPESLRTSRHWYDLVLPVIAKHQITRGGPVILMQLENEYDSWRLDDAPKRDYITALAEMAWGQGIVVPLITCWTRQVRERGNAAMTHIADFCNFYPRWNIVGEVIPGLQKLRREQPDSPVGVTELQGGWFSEMGGKLSHDQPGIGPLQLNMVSKTAVEQGAAFFNYYMGFGGTNFDWAAKGLTTTYDYDAPLREPGGLGDKYYVARGIGESLRLLGDALARAEFSDPAPESTNKAVSATLRLASRGGRPSGALFLRENANADQTFRLRLPDPARPGRTRIVPRRGTLLLGARGMKMCPIGLGVGDDVLLYSTAEVLAQGDAGRRWLVLYDEPNRPIEFALAGVRAPRLIGPASYHAWESGSRAAVIGLSTGEEPRMLLVNGRLQVILLQTVDALRTWAADFPRALVTGESDDANATCSVPFFSDAALLSGAGHDGAAIWAALEFQPGNHAVAALLPRQPATARVNGASTDVSYDARWQTARVQFTAPPLPVKPVGLSQADVWVERFEPAVGHWAMGPLEPLEKTGVIPYGYVKYRREFHFAGEETLRITAFADDGKKVFLNGKLVPAASVSAPEIAFPLAGLAKPGSNILEICYELFGSPNFGPKIGELKGIRSAALTSGGTETPLEGPWELQRVPAPIKGREIDPDFQLGWWAAQSLPSATASGSQPEEMVPAFTWCRATFALAEPPENWRIPWRVALDASRDALLYLNGKFVGRYATVGPQGKFYLPETYLRFGQQENTLLVVLAYAESAQALRTLRIEPYDEFSTWRARVEFGW